MANKDASFGLKPVRMMGGSPYSGGQSRYRIAANYGTSIFQGDLVMQVTGGGIEIHADGGTVPIVGVFNGCMYTDPTTSEQVFSNYYPASTNASDIIAFVHDDPNTVFEIQADDTFPVADLFGNFDIVYTNSGSTYTGISGAELDVTTGATSNVQLSNSALKNTRSKSQCNLLFWGEVVKTMSVSNNNVKISNN